GDVHTFIRINPRNRQPVHWGAGRDIDGGDVIEPPDGNDVSGPAEPRDDDVAAPGHIGTVRGDGGSKPRCAGQLDAGDVDGVVVRGVGGAPVKKVSPFFVARNVKGVGGESPRKFGFGGGVGAPCKPRLRDVLELAAVLDLRAAPCRYATAGHEIDLQRFSRID